MLPQHEPEATVVVCEDDAPTLELLCDHLEADRFRALPAPTASDALRLCHFKQPDILLLDLNLPDAPGLDVLREIRACEGVTGHYDPQLPVIVISGRGTDADRLRGFDCGADDYVVKPFAIQEVVLRIRAVLRRRDARRAGPLRVGEIFVDTVRREASVGGRKVSLANKEFAHQRTEKSAANQQCFRVPRATVPRVNAWVNRLQTRLHTSRPVSTESLPLRPEAIGDHPNVTASLEPGTSRRSRRALPTEAA